MYLENSDQVIVSGEGAPSTETMLAEQCQGPKLPEAADLTASSKVAELGLNVLVEYTEETVSSLEMDPSSLYNSDEDFPDDAEPRSYCNGHNGGLAQFSASDESSESDETLDDCETLRLSHQFAECAQHCECLKPCKSPENCANHSVASKCSPCCEHSAEHLQLFQQCTPSDQHYESFDSETDTLEGNIDHFGQWAMSDFTPECTDLLELQQQYEPSGGQQDCVDSEPDVSTEDFEKCDISDSVDVSDCGTECCEYDEIQNEIECTEDNDESYPGEGKQEENATEVTDEESYGLTDAYPLTLRTNVKVNFDESEQAPFAGECFENHKGSEEEEGLSPHHSELWENDKTTDCAEYFQEEDGSSECSSIETKSFKTCADGSIPSEPCSDSSGESEKGAQEDSSDEQTQWESFEEDDNIEQSNISESNNDRKETPTVDVVIEDYFDLFDRADNHGYAFAQRQLYISCFDGGDIQYVEERQPEAQKHVENKYKVNEFVEEISVQQTDVCFDAPEEACEDASERGDTIYGSCESEEQPDEWEEKSESNLALDEYEEDESSFVETDGIDAGNCVNNDEEALVYLSTSDEERMCAPCAEGISVEGDAYEDNISASLNVKSLDDNTSLIDNRQTIVSEDEEPIKEQPDRVYSNDEEVFSACSERESYWLLMDDENEMCDPGVEEYYAHEIQSIQTSAKQILNGFIAEESSHDEIINGKTAEDSSRNEREDAVSSQEEADVRDVEAVCQEECRVIELRENSSGEQTEESDDDCGLNEISRAPPGVIHSVEHANTNGRDSQMQDKRTEDSEEDNSDDESIEPCDCEYCSPPILQVFEVFAVKY